MNFENNIITFPVGRIRNPKDLFALPLPERRGIYQENCVRYGEEGAFNIALNNISFETATIKSFTQKHFPVKPKTENPIK